jgi:hypothetical protein
MSLNDAGENQSRWCGREITVCGHEVKWRDMGGMGHADEDPGRMGVLPSWSWAEG